MRQKRKKEKRKTNKSNNCENKLAFFLVKRRRKHRVNGRKKLRVRRMRPSLSIEELEWKGRDVE
jgi:hypothetical protein